MAAKPSASPTPTAPTMPAVQAPGERPSVGEVWAFRAFALVFIATLLIGLLSFLLSYLKYRS